MTRAFRAQAAIYRRFAHDRAQHCAMDFSREALHRQWEYETYGTPHPDCKQGLFMAEKINGYAYGKHVQGYMTEMFVEDLRDGILTKAELLEWLPRWWVRRTFSRVMLSPEGERGRMLLAARCGRGKTNLDFRENEVEGSAE